MTNKFSQIYQQRNANPFSGMVALQSAGANQSQEQQVSERAFFESVSADQTDDAIGNAGIQAARADSMAMILEWLADGDDTAEALDIYAQGLGDVDMDGEVAGDEEEAIYQDSLTLMAEALVYLGVPASTASSAMEGDDAAAAKAFVTAGDAVENSSDDEDTIINKFAVRETMMLEATVKVVRDGQLKTIRRPLRRKRLSAAQRAALKKARTKAHSASARAARRKSLRIRKSRGL